MSRIGKMPIALANGVSVSVDKANVVTVKGPKGELKQQLDPDITVELEDSTLKVVRPTDQKRHKAMHKKRKGDGNEEVRRRRQEGR